VFNKLPSQVVVTWSTMILGHVKCRQGQKALELFQQMKQEGVWPNSVTFVGVLKACDSVIALGRGHMYSSSSHHSNWFGDECFCGE